MGNSDKTMVGVDIDADSGLSVTASGAVDGFSREVVAGAEITEADDVIENHLRLDGDGPAVGTAFVISVLCTAVGDADRTGPAGAGIRTVVGD